MSAPDILYGDEALAALGLSKIGLAEWIGRCPTCGDAAVFRITRTIGKTMILRCPDDCRLRQRRGER